MSHSSSDPLIKNQETGTKDVSAAPAADVTNPTGTFSAPATANSVISVTVAFNEPVTGIEITDFVITNGTASNFAGSDETYTFDVTATADGLVTIDAPAAIGQDDAGNPTEDLASIQVDFNDDLVTFTDDMPASTNASPISVTLTASKVVTGLDAGDLTPTGGTISNFSGSGTTYTFDLNVTGTGTASFTVAANSVTDQYGNQNAVYNSGSTSYDLDSPTFSDDIAGGYTNTSPISVTLTASEVVTGLDAGDISPTNASLSNFSGSGTTYTFDLTPSGQGVVSFSISQDACQDGQGNGNAAYSSNTITYDTEVPTFTDDMPATSSAAVLNVSLTVSETVTGLDAGDITVTNGALSNFAGSASAYTFDITPTASGDVSFQIAVDSATDLAGNTSAVYNSGVTDWTNNNAASVISLDWANGTITGTSIQVPVLASEGGTFIASPTSLDFIITNATYGSWNAGTSTVTITATGGNINLVAKSSLVTEAIADSESLVICELDEWSFKAVVEGSGGGNQQRVYYPAGAMIEGNYAQIKGEYFTVHADASGEKYSNTPSTTSGTPANGHLFGAAGSWLPFDFTLSLTGASATPHFGWYIAKYSTAAEVTGNEEIKFRGLEMTIDESGTLVTVTDMSLFTLDGGLTITTTNYYGFESYGALICEDNI